MNRITSHPIAGVVIIAMLTAIAGCKENPSSPNGNHAPSAPRNVRAVDVVGSVGSAIDVLWDAPTDSEGISSYVVWWQATSSATVDSAVVDGTLRARRLTNLTASAYTISVAARRGDSLSPKATLQWTRPSQAGIPAPPDSVSAEFTTSTVAHVRWQAPSDTGISAYRISWADLMSGRSGARVMPSPALSVDLDNLDCSAEYRISVQSVRGTDTSISVWVDSIYAPTPDAPFGLKCSARSETSIIAQWEQPSDTEATRHVVEWRIAGSTAGVMDTTAQASYVLTGLQKEKVYDISVRSLRCTRRSEPVTMQYAGARHYGDVTTLRMYEQSSANGAGFIIDPSLGGPMNASMSAARNPNIGNVQLAIYLDNATPSSFVIGPAHAFTVTEYSASGQCDRNTYVSDSAYMVAGLDQWYAFGSIEGHIPLAGNLQSFVLPMTLSSGLGYGFWVRTGVAGNRHYARVFIRNGGGKLLQGTAPNRYVEFELSYQETPNAPFAKPAPGGGVPVQAIASHVRR